MRECLTAGAGEKLTGKSRGSPFERLKLEASEGTHKRSYSSGDVDADAGAGAEDGTSRQGDDEEGKTRRRTKTPTRRPSVQRSAHPSSGLSAQP
jgi:hypothetical protein